MRAGHGRLRLGTAALAAVMALASAAEAAQFRLIPAAPQPEALEPGLAVRYAYPADVKSLGDARNYIRRGAEPGEPLAGLDYPDTRIGEKALTSRRAEFVAAEIKGYIRFDAPGTWRLEFHSNDGLEVNLGGQRLYVHDGRHPCETQGWVAVEVPAAGWYPLEAGWFQRLNTSCLMLRVEGPDGTRRWTNVSDYGFRAE